MKRSVPTVVVGMWLMAVGVVGGQAIGRSGMEAGSAVVAGDAAEMENREARLAVLELGKQVTALKKDLAEARRQITELSEALADARSEADEWKLKASRVQDTGALDVTDDVSPAETMRIVDVNPELAMVVVGAGRTSGIKAGMSLNVFRGKEWIGVVEATDVRERISGAVVKETQPGSYPEKDDRLVVRQAKGR